MEAAAPASRSRAGYWILALLLAAILLYFSLRGIDWAEVWRTIAGANPFFILLTLATSSFALALRALRWRILLQSGAPISFTTAFWATAAGYFGNNFLPARAGEVVRALMVSRKSGLSKAFVLTTALSERLCDAIALVIISSIALLSLPVKPGWLNHAARPFAFVGISGVLIIAILPRLEKVCEAVLRRLPFPEAIREKLGHIVGQILIGLRAFHDGGRLFRFLVLTTIIWFSDAVGTVLGMKALHLSLSLPVAFLLITGLGLGSALPSTPGYVGIYQFVAVSVLVPFGLSRSDAIAYILLAQALQYVLITSWGLIGVFKGRGVRVDEKLAEASAPEITSNFPSK